MVALYDENVVKGNTNLYGWQKSIHSEYANMDGLTSTKTIDVVAANGSGKSKNIIAPCALFTCAQYDEAEVVVTTASGSQLDRQTSRYVKELARKINTYHKSDLFTIQDRKLVFSLTNGYIDLFATDEEGKAEGWHQRDFDRAFSIIVDEAKTVADNIFTSLDRCHDAQIRLHVSSPAIRTSGYFYRSVTDIQSAVHKVFKVTAFECPHISIETIRKIIRNYGRYSPITKSIVDAEFSSSEEQVVITYDNLLKLLSSPPLPNISGHPKRVGIDMAAGGDEDVIDIWQGNKELALIPFREPDTTKAVDYIKLHLTNHGITKDSEFIFADDGGVGRSMIDMLCRDGWNIKRVLNQSKAANNQMFGNRGAEMWFNFATYVINEELIFLNDDTRLQQLSSRYYRQTNQKFVLESKRDAKAKGHPSPDRADATILAFTGMSLAPYFSLLGNEKQEEKVLKFNRNTLTSEELEQVIAIFNKRRDASLFQLDKLSEPQDFNKQTGGFLNGDLSRVLSSSGGSNEGNVIQSLFGRN